MMRQFFDVICDVQWHFSAFFGGMLVVFGLGTLSAQPVSGPPATGATLANEVESLRTTVKTFFETISDPVGNGVPKGLDELLKNSPVAGEEKEKTIAALSVNIKEITKRFGTYQSFEPIGYRMFGRDLVILRYLYKCRDYPVVWYFTFYRPSPATGEAPPRPWSLIHFYYDSNLNIPVWDPPRGAGD